MDVHLPIDRIQLQPAQSQLKGLRLPTQHHQQVRVCVMRSQGIGPEFEGSLKCLFRRAPVPLVGKLHQTERRMGFFKVGVQFNGS